MWANYEEQALTKTRCDGVDTRTKTKAALYIYHEQNLRED